MAWSYDDRAYLEDIVYPQVVGFRGLDTFHCEEEQLADIVLPRKCQP